MESRGNALNGGDGGICFVRIEACVESICVVAISGGCVRPVAQVASPGSWFRLYRSGAPTRNKRLLNFYICEDGSIYRRALIDRSRQFSLGQSPRVPRSKMK